MFALSTAWNADRGQDGAQIVRDIAALGFQQIELNFSLTQAMVADISRTALQLRLSITSLHNYCPIPPGLTRQEALPDYYSLTSLDEDQRRAAVAYTKKTVDTAHAVQAKAVVLHCGRVEMPDRTRALISMKTQGLDQTPDGRSAFAAFMQERQQKSAAYLARLLKSLDELAAYAQKRNVMLGLENRFYFREIPSFDEFGVIFDRFPAETVRYWHDVGHAFIFEQLGFIQADALLERYGNRLAGFHLHNVKNLVDHQAPTDGDFDVKRLTPWMKPDVIKVFEIHSHVPADLIRSSKRRMEETFA